VDPQAPVVEPVHPFERGELDGVDVLPWPSASNDLGLEQPDDGLGESVVIRVADASNRSLDSRAGEPLGLPDREVLRSMVT
jgi:hypothetical protein